jgi:hypothetical protein
MEDITMKWDASYLVPSANKIEFDESTATYSRSPLPMYPCSEIETKAGYRPFSNVDQSTVDQILGNAICIDPRELEFSGG